MAKLGRAVRACSQVISRMISIDIDLDGHAPSRPYSALLIGLV